MTYLPDVGDDGEFLFSVLKAVFDELVEADRVNEEGAVNALDGLGLEVGRGEAVLLTRGHHGERGEDLVEGGGLG